MIRYNGEDLETSGNRANWGTPKFFEFIPVPGAILEIGGEEATPRDNYGYDYYVLYFDGNDVSLYLEMRMEWTSSRMRQRVHFQPC